MEECMAYKKSNNKDNVPPGYCIYDFYVRYKGRRYRKRITCKKSEVELFHYKWMIEFMQIEDMGDVTLFESIELYLAHIRKTKPNNAIRFEERVMDRVRSCFVDMQLCDFRRYHVEEFIYWCRQMPQDGRSEQLMDSTINRYVAVLSMLFSFCITREFYNRPNPCFKAKIKTDSIRHVFLSNQQFEELFSKAASYSDEIYMAVMLAVLAGLRRGEIVSLEWSDVDFERGYINLRAEITKTKRTRSIPMPDMLSELLAKRKQAQPFNKKVFTWQTVGGLTSQWKRLRKRLSFKEISGGLRLRFHDLRHVYGQSLRDAGVMLQDVQAFMGHSSVTVTEKHYAQRGGLNGREKVNKIGEVIPLKLKNG